MTTNSKKPPQPTYRPLGPITFTKEQFQKARAEVAAQGKARQTNSRGDVVPVVFPEND